jgi:hypothetical protein
MFYDIDTWSHQSLGEEGLGSGLKKLVFLPLTLSQNKLECLSLADILD